MILRVSFMDILFPEKDGFDLCRFLKSNHTTRNIPLLMLTSVPELDNRILGFDFGPDDYLVKPAPNLEIQTRIRRLLTRRSGHERLEGNHQILVGEELADPFSGYCGQEYFRFYLPEMAQWSQDASLPFSLSIFKFRTVSELQTASNVLQKRGSGILPGPSRNSHHQGQERHLTDRQPPGGGRSRARILPGG